MGLLASVSQAVTAQGANITSAQIKTEHTRAFINLELTVTSSEQLRKIKRTIEMVPGVIKVERVTQINGGGVVRDEGEDEE
jgi:(p)ppGpp synthase/HD superfamily hydrolase